MTSKTAFVIGDSISQGYRHQAQEALRESGIHTEWFVGGSSAQVLAGLPEWIPGRHPDLIQFNCGLHDARYFDIARTYQQPIGNYEPLLRGVVRWLQANTDANLVWASTTPVVEDRITIGYRRFAEDILAYNAIAEVIMNEAGIPITDLHAVIDGGSAAEHISADGVHMTDSGNMLLAQAVSSAITDHVVAH